MRPLTLLGSFAMGVILGVVGLFLWWKGPPSLLAGMPGGDEPPAELERLPTKDLAAIVMRRVADGFVADTRANGVPLKYGVSFFDVAKPHGGWLCRVREYAVPLKVVRGRQIRANESWEDNLTIENRYGVWKEPTAAEEKGHTREIACDNYRDFANLISERGAGSVSRGVYLIDVASKAARSQAVDFSISCRGLKGEPCDGLALLRSVDLRKIRFVEPGSKVLDAKSARRVDHIAVASSEDQGEWLFFTIRSIQQFGRQSSDEGDVTGVEIAIQHVD